MYLDTYTASKYSLSLTLYFCNDVILLLGVLQESGIMGHLLPFTRAKNMKPEKKAMRMVDVTPNAKLIKSLKQHFLKGREKANEML